MQRCCLSSWLLPLPLLLLASVPHAASAQASAGGAGLDPEAMAQMYTSFGNPGSAARLTDSDASCAQLYAESGYLDARVAAMPKAMDPMEASAKMQEEMMQAQKKMMGGMRAKGMASSLLGMVPGVGGIAGSLASSAMSRGGNLDAMNEVTRKAMAEMQENTQAMMAVAQLQARNDHVTQLFLSRGCKVSTLEPADVATARAHLEKSEGRESGIAPSVTVPAMIESAQPEEVAP